MNIESISRINTLVNDNSTLSSESQETPFSSFFDAAVENLEEVNSLTKEADQMSVDFALG